LFNNLILFMYIKNTYNFEKLINIFIKNKKKNLWFKSSSKTSDNRYKWTTNHFHKDLSFFWIFKAKANNNLSIKISKFNQ